MQKGISQANLANLAGISVAYLSLLEQNKRTPNLDTLQNITNALDIPLSILTFLAADNTELSGFSSELIEKISSMALMLMRKPILDDVSSL